MDENLLQKLSEILKNSTPEVKKVVMEGDLDTDVLTLSNKYGLNVSESVSVKNTILLTLLGVIPVGDVKVELKKNLNIDETKLTELLKDIDAGIFEKARIKMFGSEYEEGEEVRNITLSPDKNRDLLRDQIMARTDRDSAIDTSPVESSPSIGVIDSSPVIAGSRSDLLEKLNVLDNIPTTDEVEERLSIIRNQIASIKEKENNLPVIKDDESTQIVEASPIKTKVSFPTHYSVDPYREIPS